VEQAEPWADHIIIAVIAAFTYGSFHAQSPKNCKNPPQILTKLGVFGVPTVLITHANF